MSEVLRNRVIELDKKVITLIHENKDIKLENLNLAYEKSCLECDIRDLKHDIKFMLKALNDLGERDLITAMGWDKLEGGE